MARFCGKVGYAETKEAAPSVWIPEITERTYYGDVYKDASKRQTGDKVNDDISLGNQFSIVADGYAWKKYPFIAYVEWMGVKWKVTGVEAQRPRLILTVGGVYNGDKA